MEWFSGIWRAVAIGATAGVFIGLMNTARQRKNIEKESEEQKERRASFGRSMIRVMSKGMYVVLGIALIWTVYFLGVGLFDPAKTEYAANAATLIVSVVTVFSIMIAFYEFMNRK